jgi:hypothetical protein
MVIFPLENWAMVVTEKSFGELFDLGFTSLSLVDLLTHSAAETSLKLPMSGDVECRKGYSLEQIR